MSSRADRRRESRQTGKQKSIGAAGQGSAHRCGPSILQGRPPHAASMNAANMKPAPPPPPTTTAEAAGRTWAEAEAARLRGDHFGFIEAASATLGIQPDHPQAMKAIRRERAAVAVQRAMQDEGWETSVWHAQSLTSGLPESAPVRAANLARWERLADNWRRVLRSDPRSLIALSRLGVILEQMGRDEEALHTALRALSVIERSARRAALSKSQRGGARGEGTPHPALSPAAFLNAVGLLLGRLGRHGEASEATGRLLNLLESEDAEAAMGVADRTRAAGRLLLRSLALGRLGRYAEALDFAERAGRLAPENDHCRETLGWALIRMGHVSRGYTELALRGRPLNGYLGAGAVMWDGSPLAGRRLRICSWEGMGDAVQYARYLPLLNRKGPGREGQGGSVLLVCDDGMERLFRSLQCASSPSGSFTVVPWSLHRADHLASIRRGDRGGWDKGRGWDVDIGLDQLPCLFGDDADPNCIPSPGGYLGVTAEDVDRMRALIVTGKQAAPAPLRVGLIWAGNPDHQNDRNRSLPLAMMAPLASVSGVQLFALQKGKAAEAEETPPGMNLDRLGPHLRDMADTAAAMSLLDLVITVDSSPCHLAGALGVPCWTLIPEPAEWRWQADREDTPWYSSMRLFRQKSPGDWPEVIARVAAALTALADGFVDGRGGALAGG